jgi:hypothetical protein
VSKKSCNVTSISLEMLPTALSHVESFLQKEDLRALKCTSRILAGKAMLDPDVLSVDQVVRWECWEA